MYNVTETKLKLDAVEKIPSESDTKTIKVPISRNALLSYSKNMYPNKFGQGDIRACATPIVFTKTALVGSFIY